MTTDAAIKAAIKNVSSEVTLTDKSQGRGGGSLMLVVRRLADGNVSAQWFAQVKRDGKRSKKAIGRYPDLSLALARQMMTGEISPSLMAGKQLRVAASGEKPTLERMFQGYVDSMKEKGRASATEVERMLLLAEYNAADAMGRTRLAADIDDADVVAYVTKFYQRGHRGAADKARSYVASAFSWAKKSANDYTSENRRDWGIKANPAADVQKDAGAIKTRDRNLSAEELKALWNAASADNECFGVETAACIRLLIGCGQRVQETLRVDGSEIDLVGATWNMPAHKTKGGKRPHSIPLPKQVLPVLRELIELHGDGPLFPSRAGSKSALIHHSSIKQVIDRWLALEGVTVPAFQTRDLRRSWTSRAGETEMDTSIRDLIQQHAQTGTASKHYDRAQYLPKMRKAMDIWEAWLADALAEKELLADVAA